MQIDGVQFLCNIRVQILYLRGQLYPECLELNCELLLIRETHFVQYGVKFSIDSN